MLVDAHDNVVINQSEDGRLVAVVGLSGMVIVQTPQITLVCPTSEAERIKELLAQVTETSSAPPTRDFCLRFAPTRPTVVGSGRRATLQASSDLAGGRTTPRVRDPARRAPRREEGGGQSSGRVRAERGQIAPFGSGELATGYLAMKSAIA